MKIQFISVVECANPGQLERRHVAGLVCPPCREPVTGRRSDFTRPAVFATAKHLRAFSLLEVMIAIAIFFMVSFSILALVSSGLRTARALRVTRPSAGILAAELSLTNQLEEGTESGDFGNLYPDYNWTRESYEAFTNGLWQVDFKVYRRGQRGTPDSQMSLLIYSPGSRTRRLGLQP